MVKKNKKSESLNESEYPIDKIGSFVYSKSLNQNTFVNPSERINHIQSQYKSECINQTQYCNLSECENHIQSQYQSGGINQTQYCNPSKNLIQSQYKSKCINYFQYQNQIQFSIKDLEEKQSLIETHLRSKNYKELLKALKLTERKTVLQKTKYDISTTVLPYNDEVSKAYELKYVNCSFILRKNCTIIGKNTFQKLNQGQGVEFQEFKNFSDSKENSIQKLNESEGVVFGNSIQGLNETEGVEFRNSIKKLDQSEGVEFRNSIRKLNQREGVLSENPIRKLEQRQCIDSENSIKKLSEREGMDFGTAIENGDLNENFHTKKANNNFSSNLTIIAAQMPRKEYKHRFIELIIKSKTNLIISLMDIPQNKDYFKGLKYEQNFTYKENNQTIFEDRIYTLNIPTNTINNLNTAKDKIRLVNKSDKQHYTPTDKTHNLDTPKDKICTLNIPINIPTDKTHNLNTPKDKICTFDRPTDTINNLLDLQEPFENHICIIHESSEDNTHKFKVRRIVYKQWPDMGIPNTSQLKKLIQHIESLQKNTIIVHCKGGVGRTGAFLMIYLSKIYNLNSIREITALLVYLRSRRKNMIFTPEQLRFCIEYILNEKRRFDM